MYNYVHTPFNIDLLILKNNDVRGMQQVTTTTIFEPSSNIFTADGLFSSTIFGPVGSLERNERFAYIDLKVDVLHPLLYQHVCSLKSLYKDVMLGKKYVKYDNKTKDLVLANIDDGYTGYSYFISVLPKLSLTANNSDQREFRLKILKLYKEEKGLLNKWLVLPAGLRDYIVNKDGKPSEDEVNNIYRKLILTTNLLNNIKVTKNNMNTIDPIIVKIQSIINEIYEYYKTMLDGKHKFIQGKWAKRAVVNGTRNVLTPSMNNMTKLDQENVITTDDVVIGLYQFIRGILPIAINKVLTKFIYKFMSPDSEISKLVDMKSLTTKTVTIHPKKKAEWVTAEGLDGTLGKLEQKDIRSKPIVIDGNYLCLIHDRNNVITIITDTNNMDSSFESKYIRPITYAEMVYIAIYDIRNKYPALATRYPAINMGSIFPSKLYIKTTENPRTVKVIMDGRETTMYEYPKLDASYIDSMAVPAKQLEALGADFDGDLK